MLFDPEAQGADYEALHVLQDAPTRLRSITVVHSTRLGPAFGGIRRKIYASEVDALDDARRLAEAMTHKCALAGLPAGGAKTVMLDEAELAHEPAYRHLGAFIDAMGGRYIAGPDIGTTRRELDWIRQETNWVNPPQNDASDATARGVVAGLRGMLRGRGKGEKISGSKVVIEGLGSVGTGVARRLLAEGAEVAGYDIVPEKIAAAAELGVRSLTAQRLYLEPCDIFMPCALGGGLSADRVRQADWRMVCGSANNQLQSPEVERVMLEHDITWAPDVVVSAGAVIEGVLTVLEQASKDEVQRAIDAIADTCGELVGASRQQGVPAERLCRERAERALS